MIDLTDNEGKNNPPSLPTKLLITVAEAQQYLKAVTEKVMAFAGKPGYNAYLFAEQSGLTKLNGQVGALTDNSNQALLQQALAFQYQEPSLENLKSLFIGESYA